MTPLGTALVVDQEGLEPSALLGLHNPPRRDLPDPDERTGPAREPVSF
jgi:hypothetical protein